MWEFKPIDKKDNLTIKDKKTGKIVTELNDEEAKKYEFYGWIILTKHFTYSWKKDKCECCGRTYKKRIKTYSK